MTAKKKNKFNDFSLTPGLPVKKQVVLPEAIDIDEATKKILQSEKVQVEKEPQAETTPVKKVEAKPVKKKKVKQREVMVQVPTPKDTYLKAKSLVIEKEIKGIKYLYLDALDYYLKHKIYENNDES